MTTRRGKVARLPQAVREELNRRLQNGETGKQLVAWLNGLPEVKRVLAEYFGGSAIREQSLSEWRKGGFHECLVEQQMLVQAKELTADPAKAQALMTTGLAENLTKVLALRFAEVLTDWNGAITPESERKIRALGNICAAVLKVRKEGMTEKWKACGAGLTAPLVEAERAEAESRNGMDQNIQHPTLNNQHPMLFAFATARAGGREFKAHPS